MVCLDTSVLVALMRKDETAMDSLGSAAAEGSTLSTTVISLCELYAGAYGSREPGKELERVRELRSRLEILELDEAASRRYGELANDPRMRHEPVGDFDLIISSIALEHQEKLATRNTKHFSRVPGLIVEEW
jgi:tRNA(fMet)-specific endonuclease VapC